HTRFSRDWSSDVCSSDLNLECNPCWEVGLDNTGNDIGRWSLSSNNHVDTNGTSQLGYPCDRQFHFLSGSHNKVGKLINYNYNIRQETVSLFGVEFALGKLMIVLLNISCVSLFEKVVAFLHLNC